MIKILLGIFIILLLFGGAVSFESTDESWGLYINKTNIFSSLQSGFVKIYDLLKALIN